MNLKDLHWIKCETQGKGRKKQTSKRLDGLSSNARLTKPNLEDQHRGWCHSQSFFPPLTQNEFYLSYFRHTFTIFVRMAQADSTLTGESHFEICSRLAVASLGFAFYEPV